MTLSTRILVNILALVFAAIGHGTTLPCAAQDTAVSRILFGSCIKQDQEMPILDTIVRRDPDLFVFLGDNIYADTTDLEVMRVKYAKLRADSRFAELLGTCPVMATWDDHDYGVNDGGSEYPQRAGSQRIFVDFWGDDADSPRRRRPGVYDAKRFGPPGKRLQIILLDTRYFRGPLLTGERRLGGPYVPTSDPNVTMLGDAQWTWLEEQLRLPADVRVIASGIQCVSQAAGHETWANLPQERQRLFDLIDETGANGVVVLSGDRHWAELSVETQAVPYPIYDLTSSSLNQTHARGTPTENDKRLLPTTYHRENFGELWIDWAAPNPRLELRILDLDGNVALELTLKLAELQAR